MMVGKMAAFNVAIHRTNGTQAASARFESIREKALMKFVYKFGRPYSFEEGFIQKCWQIKLLADE
jgi:hypothetical protein